jgi:two-component system sensor histidine kinase PilS (NtrC family)
MYEQPLQDAKTKKWSMLLVYNVYRLVIILLLFGLFWLEAYNRINALAFCGALLLYTMFGLTFFYLWYARALQFEQQVLWSGAIDTIVIVLFINAIGYIQSGLGILLNALIAMLSILMPGRLAIFFASVASCMLLGISIFQYEYGNQQNFNTFFSTGIYGAGFFATAITALYLANWVRVTEHLAKHRGQELLSMQRLNEYIIGRLQYGVIYLDAERKVKLINKAAREFFNHDSNKKLTLRGLSRSLHQKYQEYLSKKKSHKIPAHTILEKHHLQVHFFPSSVTENPEVLIILEDMALIGQQAQQLKLASLGRFSASIAHELRNPLGVIMHAVQLMGDEGELSQEDERLKELVMKNGARMNAVIENVLKVSRRQQASPESIQLTAFLKRFKHEYCLINICKMKINIPQNKLKTIVFDPNHLEQILVILSDNAMQHGRDEAGQVEIAVSVKHQGPNMSLEIRDSGPGIPHHLHNEVFEAFFTTAHNGNGMGLFIARDLCEINQAHLSLIETENGCCMAITLNQNQGLEL